PASQADLEVAASEPEGHGLDWADAGPVSHDEKWDHFIHDGGRSVTWEMDAAPEGAVDERVLQRLLAPNPEVPRKRIAIVYRPHSAADAAEIVDDDFKNALVAQQSERGVVSAAATLRVGATQQAREEQARGHGVTRFGALVTITEPLRGDLPRIEAITRDLSTQARLKIRRCYRYQGAAFAASLGCGVILPEHATIPKALAGGTDHGTRTRATREGARGDRAARAAPGPGRARAVGAAVRRRGHGPPSQGRGCAAAQAGARPGFRPGPRQGTRPAPASGRRPRR